MKDIFQRLQAEGNVGSFDEAMELIHTLWTKIHPECVFSEDEPSHNDSEDVPLPHIVYDMTYREHTEQMSDGRKPRIIQVKPDPEQPGHNLTEATEFFDCVAEFVIYANTNRQAREWAEKFELFILTYTGYFKQKGIQEIVFLNEQRPEVSTKYRQDLPHRVLHYLVRIQRSRMLRSIRLSEIETEVSMQNPDETTTVLYPTREAEEFMELYQKRVQFPTKQ